MADISKIQLPNGSEYNIKDATVRQSISNVGVSSSYNSTTKTVTLSEGSGGGGGSVTIESLSVTPSETAQTYDSSSVDGYKPVTVGAISSTYIGSGITQRTSSDLSIDGYEMTAPSGYYANDATINMPLANTELPTATKGAVSNHTISITPYYTVTTGGYLDAGTENGTAVTVSASELVSGNLSITSSGTKDVTNYATASVSSGSATGPSSISGTSASVSTGTNTLTLTKTNVSTTPTVTAGYVASATSSTATVTLTANITTKAAATITPGTTDQTISSGTYLTGTQTISGDADLVAGNIKKDVSIFGVTGTYEGGGGSSSMMVATATCTLTTAGNSIGFENLLGEPTSYAVVSTGSISPSATDTVSSVVYDGTTVHTSYINNTSGSQVNASDYACYGQYVEGGLYIYGSPMVFAANTYKLVYNYNGSASNIGTEDVQVGSGATSITFTGLSDEPSYFSCIFKSSFSTSSGYQRVITVVYDGTDIYGLEMDSQAKYSDAHWSYTYNNGSLTITSSGTNAGGYFHQPGYYQLTYGIGGDNTLQTKTVTPTTSTQNVTADTAQGYTALKKVVVNPIPSSYVEPTTTVGATTYRASTSSQTINAGTYHSAAATIAAVSQTNLSADNIKSGTTITISNGQSNLWSVTGTYDGGGGTSKNVQISQTPGRAASSTYTAVGPSITVSKTGTYDVYWSGYRSSTSGTNGSQLYIGSSAYGSAQTTFNTGSGLTNTQSVHLSNVSLTANQVLTIRARSRGSNYYMYILDLIIIEA